MIVIHFSKNRKSLFLKMILIFLFVWVALSAIRVVFNWARMLTFEKQDFFMTSVEKKRQYFGNMYNIIEYVDSKTEHDARVILIADNVNNYYLSKYELYPRTILAKRNIGEVGMDQFCQYDYFVGVGEKKFESLELVGCSFIMVSNDQKLDTIIYKKDG